MRLVGSTMPYLGMVTARHQRTHTAAKGTAHFSRQRQASCRGVFSAGCTMLSPDPTMAISRHRHRGILCEPQRRSPVPGR